MLDFPLSRYVLFWSSNIQLFWLREIMYTKTKKNVDMVDKYAREEMKWNNETRKKWNINVLKFTPTHNHLIAAGHLQTLEFT